MMESLKDFKVHFPAGYLAQEEGSSGVSGTEEIISEEDAVQKIAQLRIKSTYLENLNQRQVLSAVCQSEVAKFQFSAIKISERNHLLG